MRSLSAAGQTFTMTQTAVAAQVHQAFNVNTDFTAKFAFDMIFMVNQFTQFQNFIIRQLAYAAGVCDVQFPADFAGQCPADAVDIRQSDNHALVRRNIYTSNTCQVLSPITNQNLPEIPKKTGTTNHKVFYCGHPTEGFKVYLTAYRVNTLTQNFYFFFKL